MTKQAHIHLPEGLKGVQLAPEGGVVVPVVSPALPKVPPVIKKQRSFLSRCLRTIFFLIAFTSFQALYTYGLFIAYSKLRPETTQQGNIPQPETSPSKHPTVPTTKPERPTSTQTPGRLVLDTTKVATIVDTRLLPGLVPLILHYMGVLGSDWPVKIFHSAENYHIFNNSAPIRKYIAAGRITLTELPKDTNLARRTGLSSFLTNRWIWEQLAPASYVLFFQLDSIICGNSNKAVEDYFQYDMIGAPWKRDWGVHWGANGGLSLRRREKILQVLDNYKWEGSNEPEDVFFVKRLTWLPNSTHPTDDISKTFSVEQIWYDKPVGYHQPIQKWQSTSFFKRLEQWCPEYYLAKEYEYHN